MTSTYDNLGSSLYYEVKDTPQIQKLVEIIYDYAIAEVNRVNPKILHWDTWKAKDLYGEGFDGKAHFLNSAHNSLDHTSEYHLKTINVKLDIIIHIIHDWFVAMKGRDDRFWGIDRLPQDKATRTRYPKIFAEIKRLVEINVIQVPEWDRRVKGKVAKW